MNNLIPTYDRIPLSFSHGEGSWLYENNGEKYLDFTSGIAVNSLGHNHPELIRTITEQSQKLLHISNLFEIPEQTELAEQLCKITGYESAFFTNSGTESNEAAIKLAKKHTGRNKIISFRNGFHGRTMGALSITGKEEIQKDFKPLLPHCQILPFNDIEELNKNADLNTAAIIFEFIQGEGGVNEIDKNFLEEIFKLAKQLKILTIADEVQTGVGRTGNFLAADYFKVKPDIVSLAKGLGGGIPIGAILTKQEIGKSFNTGSHGSTFGGNPLACSAALTVIKEITKPTFKQELTKNIEYFHAKIEELLNQSPDIILKKKGIGLLIGLEIISKNIKEQILKTLQEKHQILALGAGTNTIRILPPLTVQENEIEIFDTKLKQTVEFLCKSGK